MKVYMKVTNDKYELPIAIADNRLELAKMLGLNRTAVYQIMYQAKVHNRKSQYIEVEIDDGATDLGDLRI